MMFESSFSPSENEAFIEIIDLYVLIKIETF